MTSACIYVVAGEASGDLLGARLIESLKKKVPIEAHGVGGARMKTAGVSSLFPYQDLSIIGMWEIIPHIPKIFKRLKDTFEDIRQKQPSVIITIDSPGFNFRLAERLKNHPETKHIKRIHYVAPTVWAYRPERAVHTASLFDHMFLLLPFEPPYFEEVGLPCTFIGHQVAWEWKQKGSRDAFINRHSIAADKAILCLLPGSRKGEITRLLPIFEQTVNLLHRKTPNLLPVIVAAAPMEMHLRTICQHWKISPLIVPEATEKKDAFAASSVALAKSGTVALELALAGVPTVVTYKVSRYSAWALRRMVKVRFVNLVNLLLGKEVIPEMLQENCSADLLFEKLFDLLGCTHSKKQQLEQSQEAIQMLGVDDALSPSDKAADIVLGLMEKN
jgi:lipid-A-disaccharide synthase